MLTIKAIKASKPKSKPYKLPDNDNLYLYITPAGTKSWRINYQFNGKRKILTLGKYPFISLKEARQEKDIANKMLVDGRDPAVERNDPFVEQKKKTVFSKMAAGQTVKIACYGDSTTDGNLTSGWIKNTFDTNHNDDAPNAWPKQLQIILREMYKNENIFVFNAGYSGQRLDNAWGTQNYEKSIINNPHYGPCDIVFISFGFNDADSTTINLLDDTLIQTNLLIDKIKDSDALPILLTCNVACNKETEDNDNKSFKKEQFNNLKKYIAKMRNIPLFDQDAIMHCWMQNNNCSYADMQSDNNHWGDLWHRYQASWLASMLFNHIVKIDNANTYESIHFLDARANSPIGSNTTSTTTSCKFGLNPYIPLSRFDCRNQVLLDVWVWCEHSDASIVYRRMLGDARTSNIKITDMLTGKANETTAGFLFGYDMYSVVDAPEYIGNLKYGLNRVQLIGDDSLTGNTVFGHFDFVANYQAKLINKNILQSIGVFRDYKTLTAPADSALIETNFSFTSDIYDSYGKNVIQLFTKNKTTNIYIEGKFDDMSGIFLAQAPGRNKDTISGILLYFVSGFVSVYIHCYNTRRKVNFFSKIGYVSSSADKNAVYRLRLKTYFNKNGYASIDVYHDEVLAGTISWEGVSEYLPPISGVAGNIYRFCPRGEKKTINIELSRFEVWYSER